jgi:hypothetical protein
MCVDDTTRGLKPLFYIIVVNIFTTILSMCVLTIVIVVKEPLLKDVY